jgi:Family of unknown function (DUF5989)
LGVHARAQELLAAAGAFVMALLGGLLLLTQGSAVAPLTYTLF